MHPSATLPEAWNGCPRCRGIDAHLPWNTQTYEDGQIATLWTSWATEDTARDPWTVTVKLIGAAGAGISNWDLVKNNSEPEPGWDDAAYWDSFLWVQTWFLEECLDHGRQPLSTLEDAADALSILQAAQQSLRTGKRVPFEPVVK